MTYDVIHDIISLQWKLCYISTYFDVSRWRITVATHRDKGTYDPRGGGFPLVNSVTQLALMDT